MIIDPNQPIEQTVAFVLIESGKIVLHDGRTTAENALEDAGSAFQEFCRSLDPNKCFIQGLIPNGRDQALFFKAREVARKIGMHMQAPVDTEENLRRIWDNYLASKQIADADEPPEHGDK